MNSATGRHGHLIQRNKQYHRNVLFSSFQDFIQAHYFSKVANLTVYMHRSMREKCDMLLKLQSARNRLMNLKSHLEAQFVYMNFPVCIIL